MNNQKSDMKNPPMSWSISDVWNTKLSSEKREVKERPYLSASDIGMPFLDRFYKMKGVEPTNPFDERVLRIFDAGLTIEWMMIRIFRLASILQHTQYKIVIPETKDHLSIYGYADAIVGGQPNWGEAKKNILAFIERYGLRLDDEFIEAKAMRLVSALEEQFPDGLKPIVAEIKSLNSMAFHSGKNSDTAGFFAGYPHHKLQLLTYLLGQEIKEGRLFYISRDDLCLQETAVFPTKELIDIWEKDVKTMSNFFRKNIKPAKEPDIVFNEDTKKWEANWRLGRSIYLTKICGEKDKATWEKKQKSKVGRLNRVLKKIKSKEKLTTDNLKVIKEMRGQNKVLDKILPKKGVKPSKELREKLEESESEDDEWG